VVSPLTVDFRIHLQMRNVMIKNSDVIPIVILVVLTSILALSAHALIVQYFHAPLVHIESQFNQLIGFVIRFATVVGAMIIYLLSREYWEKMKSSYRVLLFALLTMALTEQLFRSPIMGIVVGVPWEYQLLQLIPVYMGWFTLSLLVCFFMPIIQRKNKFIFLQYILFSGLATVIIFFIKNLANDVVTPLFSLAPQPDGLHTASPPYGMRVMIPSYITFLEPTIATFILFFLIKNRLSAFTTLMKGLIVGLILIIIHAGIYSIVQITYSEGNFLYRLFYYGQFLWEYMALGILTAYSFAFIDRDFDTKNWFIKK
jgi:hypothetical protein